MYLKLSKVHTSKKISKGLELILGKRGIDKNDLRVKKVVEEIQTLEKEKN